MPSFPWRTSSICCPTARGTCCAFAILTVVAAAILVTYFWTLPEPLAAVIAWNLFFIGLNLFHVVRLLLVRRSEAPINMGKGKRP